MKEQKKEVLKKEFYKKFCSAVNSPYVTDCGGPLYLFKDMGARPKDIWEWVKKYLK